MAVNTQIITREQVVALAMKMPLEKLVNWYEYGLFIHAYPVLVAASVSNEDVDLQNELNIWEAASDEDWLNFEQRLQEVG